MHRENFERHVANENHHVEDVVRDISRKQQHLTI